MIIIPTPQKVVEKNAVYYMPVTGTILIEGMASEEAKKAAKTLQKAIREYLGLEYSYTVGKGNADIHMKYDPKYSLEQYTLCVDDRGICITGGKRGMLYAVHSLTQIMMTEGDTVPQVVIEDYPQIANRGFYHDVTRGRVPTLEYFKHLADVLSFYKVNQMQFYIEHSFMFKEFSEVWRDDTPITPEEILELDAYCNSCGVELVPSLSTFGHHYKLLNTKTYGHLCEIDNSPYQSFSFVDRMEHHTFNVTDEGSFELIGKMLDEYIPLFQSDKFNICGDETFDLGKGKSKDYCEEVGLPRMYIDFVKKVIGKVMEHGKTPMMWGDIMLGFPEFVKELPKETICLDWHYDADVKEDSVKTYANLPVDVYVCPGSNGWNKLLNESFAYENIQKMCSYGHKYGVNGVLNTDWGDYGHINHPEHSIPAIIYGAEGGWNGTIEPKESIDAKISKLVFGNRSGNVLRIINEISDCQSYDWGSLVQFKELIYNVPKDTQREYIVERLNGLDDNVLATNDRIDVLLGQLREESKFTEQNYRSKLYSYKLCAEGIKIFNLLGAWAIKGRRDFEITADALARRLEYWFYDYKKLWRSVSKESDLVKIAQVISFYADYLRENR